MLCGSTLRVETGSAMKAEPHSERRSGFRTPLSHC